MIRFIGTLAAAVLAGWFLLQSPMPTAAATAVPTPGPFPVEMDIPSINAGSRLMNLGLDEKGELTPPPIDQPEKAGWYAKGVRPGDIGPAVIAGHVSGRGPDGQSIPGVFADLTDMKPGDLIHILRSDDSEVSFAVTHTQIYDKDAFPTDKVYGDTLGPELRLITCGGKLDRKHHRYEDNVVVYAVKIA